MPSETMILAVSLQRGRLALLVTLSVTLVITVTLWLRHGAELKRFDRSTLTAQEQGRLLDHYNSYSGSIASALGRPLEIFVTVMAHVVVLRFLTASVLTTETRWSIKLTVTTSGAAIGFLLTNGLNALNVQVRELPVDSVISASDLALQVDQTGTSTVQASFSEYSTQNPVTNTILRNLILQRAMMKEATCSDGRGRVINDSVDFGIPQRGWMKHLVPEAREVKHMHVEITNNSAANQALSPQDIPMNASLAADLLILSTRSDYSAFATASPFVDGVSRKNLSTTPARDEPTARLAGLLPLSPASSEHEDRKWFLKHVVPYVLGAAASSPMNATAQQWTLEMAHVDITPSIQADAITIEREVASLRVPPSLSKDGKTRYYYLDSRP